MECTLHLECTWSGVGVYFYWWVIWRSSWSGILVYTYDIRSVVGVYTPVGVVTEWLWSVHSKLECTLRQGKGNNNKAQQSKNRVHISWDILYMSMCETAVFVLCFKAPQPMACEVKLDWFVILSSNYKVDEIGELRWTLLSVGHQAINKM